MNNKEMKEIEEYMERNRGLLSMGYDHNKKSTLCSECKTECIEFENNWFFCPKCYPNFEIQKSINFLNTIHAIK